MTIGVVASGKGAGAAVHSAVLAAQVLGSGAIGGFAVFAIMDGEGRINHRVTQRGGIAELALPDSWLHAEFAAAISSGPDRPEPLQQFLPGQDGIGLVTGHRLPNHTGADGVPLNLAVLALMRQGDSPQQAIDSVLADNPEVDAGLIALDRTGRMGCGNSRRTLRRFDTGSYCRSGHGRVLALLHNAIYFAPGNEKAVGELAWGAFGNDEAAYCFLPVSQGVPLIAAESDRIVLDAAGSVVSIETANPHLPGLVGRGTAICLGAEVWRGGRRLGCVASELIATIGDGRVVAPLAPAMMAVVMKKEGHVAPRAD